MPAPNQIYRYSVSYWTKGVPGVRRALFATHGEAEAFTVGKQCWARPAFVVDAEAPVAPRRRGRRAS